MLPSFRQMTQLAVRLGENAVEAFSARYGSRVEDRDDYRDELIIYVAHEGAFLFLFIHEISARAGIVEYVAGAVDYRGCRSPWLQRRGSR